MSKELTVREVPTGHNSNTQIQTLQTNTITNTNTNNNIQDQTNHLITEYSHSGAIIPTIENNQIKLNEGDNNNTVAVPENFNISIGALTSITVQNEQSAAARREALALVEEKAKKAKRKRIVLPEEEYEQTLEFIIKRDFFPTLNNQQHIHKYNHSLTATPSSIHTNQSYHHNNNNNTPLTSNNKDNDMKNPNLTMGPPTFLPERKKFKSKADMSLSGFLSLYTSEDNESYEKIMENEKNTLIFKANKNNNKDNNTNNNQLIASEADIGVGRVGRIRWRLEQESQALSLERAKDDPNRNGVIQTWRFKDKNSLMFYPDAINLDNGDNELVTGQDKGFGLSSKEPQTIAANTRFSGKLFQMPLPSTLNSSNNNNNNNNATPLIGGYNIVSDPSPMPGGSIEGDEGQRALGAGEPFMTWGNIMATPIHLQEEDQDTHGDDNSANNDEASGKLGKMDNGSGLGSGSSNGFRIKGIPPRDQLVRRLTEKNVEKHRKAEKEKIYLTTPVATPLTHTPLSLSSRSHSHNQSPNPNGRSPLPSSIMLSPAAQKLAQKIHNRTRISF